MSVPQVKTDQLPDDPNSNPYLDYGRSVVRSRIVGKLLRFTKFGDFVAGEEGTVLPQGTRLVAHIPECLVGWQKWEDNKPTDQVMTRLCEGKKPPKRKELGDTDEDLWEADDKGEVRDPWQFTNMLVLKDPKSSQLYTFATASVGGLKAVGATCIEFGEKMRHKPNMLPVVELGRGSYDHSNKNYGEIRFPIFTIVDWVDRASFDALMSPNAGQEQLALEDKPAAAPPKKTNTRF